MRIRMTHLLCAGAGAAVFSILLGRPSAWGALAGAAAGGLFAAVSPSGAPRAEPPLGPWLLRYGARLAGDMALATARQMRAVLRPRPPQAAILHLRPAAGASGRVLVANSMTLTPGTVTLEETAEEYAVLCAEPPDTPPARRAVAAAFEGRLPAEEVRV